MVTEAKNLDYLVKRYVRRNLTTGHIADILQFSQQHAIRLCDGNILEHSYVPGSNHRRIQVEQLVSFIKRGYANLKTDYPTQQLLHFMEVVGLSPESYNLFRLTGKNGLRFHTQQALYSTGEVANLMGVNNIITIYLVDVGQLEGYKLPNSNDRRVLASAVARYVRDNKIRLEENVEIATSPEIITFPDPYLGYGRDIGEWLKGSKVADNINEKQSVWYRYNDGIHEVSIRQNEDWGLYVKLVEIVGSNPRIDLILLGEARKLDGGLLPREEHLIRVYNLLNLGKSCLNQNQGGDETQQKQAYNVVDKVLTRFMELYFSEIKK